MASGPFSWPLKRRKDSADGIRMNSESKWESNGFERLSKPIEQSNIIGCSTLLLLLLLFYIHTLISFFFFCHLVCFRSTRRPINLAFQFGDNLREEVEGMRHPSSYRIRELQPTGRRFYLANISNSGLFSSFSSFLVFFEMQFSHRRPFRDMKTFALFFFISYPASAVMYKSLFYTPQPTFFGL